MRFSDPDGKWPGEGWWNAIKAYFNKPATKAQKEMWSQRVGIPQSNINTNTDVFAAILLEGVQNANLHAPSKRNMSVRQSSSIRKAAKEIPSAKSAAIDYASQVNETSGNKIPTMTAAAVDSKTGKVYLDVSGKPHPAALHPSLVETAANPSKLNYWSWKVLWCRKLQQ